MFLAAASGLVLAFALPKPGTWLAAWVGLVPLFIAIRNLKTAQAALCGLVAGLVYYGIILYWITLFGFLPWALLITYQALYFAVFAIIAAKMSPERIGWRGFLAIPAAWVVLQYLRTLGPYAFIWGSFAHTQAANLPFAQISSITGPWGIDFALCFFNLALAYALCRGAKRRHLPLAAACLLALCLYVYGFPVMRNRPHSDKPSVAVLQGNMKNDFNPVPNYPEIAFSTFSEMTKEAASKGVKLVVWPETTIPCDITSPGWADRIGQLARQNSVEILAGGYDPSNDPKYPGSYNALFLFDKNGHKAGVYRKVQLVPFGEFVPLRDQLPFLKGYGIRPEDVAAAKTHELLDTNIGKVGVSICFESLFPEIAREETLHGAQVLCVVTNDAWFQRTQAAREHLMMAQLRAIENRRCLIRAAGTGISAVIDPLGSVRERCGLFKQGILYDHLTPSSQLTFYTRYGQWFAYLCIAMLIACLPLSFRGSRVPSGAEHPQETEPVSECPHNPR